MKTTIAKKAIIGLAIAGMAFAFSGCGDNTPATPKPKNDLERYDAAYKDMKETADKIKQFEIEETTKYYKQDQEKYALLKYVVDDENNNGNHITEIAGYNTIGNVKTPMYTQTQAKAAAEALNNIINSEDHKKMLNKIEEDQKTMKEIAEKAENNTNGSLKNKYYEDRKYADHIEDHTLNKVLIAHEEYNKMAKINNNKFWKQ